MQRNKISGTIQIPEQQRQQKLHRQLGEFAQWMQRPRTMDAKTKRRRPSTERQTEIRTDSNATNGFLKCTFLPKLKTAQSVQACEKTERDFYLSLSKLAEHYSIEPMPTRQDYGYPYNMVLAMWDMDTQMKRSHRNWDGFKLVQDSQKTFIASEERYDTGTTLFYIPRHNAVLYSHCSTL